MKIIYFDSIKLKYFNLAKKNNKNKKQLKCIDNVENVDMQSSISFVPMYI